MTEVERGRRYGIRQAAKFLREMQDEDTLAAELLKYVMPHRKWRVRFYQSLRQEQVK